MDAAAILALAVAELSPVFAAGAGLDAITVYQPYSWALVAGHKPIENRTWRPPARMLERPTWMAIHAGLKVERDVIEEIGELAGATPKIVTSAIVGLVRLARVSTRATLDPSHRAWFVGPLAWVFDRAIEFDHPVPIGGAQGLWPVPPATLVSIASRLGLGAEPERCEAKYHTGEQCKLQRGHEGKHQLEPAHRCHVRGCMKHCAPEKLMCPAHWKKVPRPLQEAVYRAYRPGQCDDKRPSRAWFEAADAAIEAIARIEGPPPPPEVDPRQLGLPLALAPSEKPDA